MNVYLKLAAQKGLKATEEEADAMIEALDGDEYREILDAKECHGIEIGYCSCGHLFVFSDEVADDQMEGGR